MTPESTRPAYVPGVATPCDCHNCNHPDEYVKVTLTSLAQVVDRLTPEPSADEKYYRTCGPVPAELQGMVFGHAGRDYVCVLRESMKHAPEGLEVLA